MKPKTKTDRTFEVFAKDAVDAERQAAELLTSPTVLGANAVRNLTGSKDDFSLVAMTETLQKQNKKIREGDLGDVEAMLAVQLQVLNAIFVKSCNHMNEADYLNKFQTYANTALKAQNMARRTAATLAEMKNPRRATFIKNTAHNQQVNVSQNSAEKPANELLSEPPKQLEAKNDETMDTGGAATPGSTHPPMEAVAKSRRQNPRRKSHQQPKRP